MRCVRNRGEAGDEHTSLTPQPLSRALNGGRQDACPLGPAPHARRPPGLSPLCRGALARERCRG